MSEAILIVIALTSLPLSVLAVMWMQKTDADVFGQPLDDEMTDGWRRKR